MSDLPQTTQRVIARLTSRAEFAVSKYGGKTMDRSDLSLAEWAQHAQDELLDGSQYLERVKGAGELLESAKCIMQMLQNERLGASAAHWLKRYEAQFGEATSAPDSRTEASSP